MFSIFGNNEIDKLFNCCKRRLSNFILWTTLYVKQRCWSDKCISNNDNLAVFDMDFYIRIREGERELSSGETESVYQERASSISTKFK